jgi:hypothetical protein
MPKEPSSTVRLIVLLTLIPISAIAAAILVITVLMQVGLLLADNYELFFSGSKGIVIIAMTCAAGGIVPILLLWRWIGEE